MKLAKEFSKIVITTLCLIVPMSAVSQATDFLQSEWRDGDQNSELLDVIRGDARNIEGPIIVIGHLGSGERLRMINQRRLHNVRSYFVGHGKMPADRVIVAEGQPVSGKGFIDVFLGGKLRFRITADRGKDIFVDCCGPFAEYYPSYRGKPILQGPVHSTY